MLEDANLLPSDTLCCMNCLSCLGIRKSGPRSIGIETSVKEQNNNIFVSTFAQMNFIYKGM